MDRKSKIFLWVLIVITMVSVFLTFRRAFYTKDYKIISSPDILNEVQ